MKTLIVLLLMVSFASCITNAICRSSVEPRKKNVSSETVTAVNISADERNFSAKELLSPDLKW